MSLACMPGPCGPKKASFCSNLLLCYFPALFSTQPSIVLKEQPILFVRKWAHYGLLIFAAVFYNVDKEWSVYTLVRVSLAFRNSSWAKWVGMNASLFVYIVKKGSKYQWAIVNPLPYKKDGLLLKDRQSRAEWGKHRETYNMMPFLGHRVRACREGSYSEKERNQKSGQNIPSYNMASGAKVGWWTKTSPFCIVILYLHP